MGLYKRKDSQVWWMSFSANGRQYQRSTGTTDKQIAQKIYDAVRGKIAMGTWVPEMLEKEKQKDYTFNDLYEKYASWAEGRQKSWSGSRGYMAKQLLRYFQGFRLDDFGVELIENFQSAQLRRGLRPGGVNRLVSLLKAMFSKAVEWEMVSEDVLKKVRKVKPLRGERKILRYLTVEECQRLIDACDDVLRPVVITALNTGMRKSEILKLKWDNIDMKHGFILLQDTATKTSEKREIPINDTLMKTLKSIPRKLDTPYVFWNVKNFRKRFEAALRRAKITDFRFHDLRHTFASQLVMAGVDITTVSKLLGHKSLTMTLRYSHLAPSHLAEGVKKLDNFLSSKNTQELTKESQKYYDFMTVRESKETEILQKSLQNKHFGA